MNRELDALVCSGPWREVCEAVLACRPEGTRAEATLNHEGIYPPGGSGRTLMRRCGSCCRWSPPYSFVGERCHDCAVAEGEPLTDETSHRSSTSSPTAMVMAALERHRVRLVEPRLPAADEESLKKMIKRFLRVQKLQKTTNVLLAPPI